MHPNLQPLTCIHTQSTDNFNSIHPLATRIIYLLLIAILFFSIDGYSQSQLIRQGTNRIRGGGGRINMTGGAGGTDSLKRRDKNEDSITVRYRYIDSARNFMLDSSINDFTRRFPIPATNVHLGNTGTASRSLLFSPIMQPGFDPGFHAFDIYRWTLDKARFFNTTRPYSELSYQLAARSEQAIEILHTQNIKPNWNFLFQYHMINSPGFFKNQKTNHNNYLFTTWYNSVNKRYNAYVAIVANKLQSGENGGVPDTVNLNDPQYSDRFNIYTKLGGNTGYSTDFFNTNVGTGNRYTELFALVRQQYDFGRKDSLVTDSTVLPLFFPRLRLEYTAQYSTRKYSYRDYVGDSVYYKDQYAIQLPDAIDTVQYQDRWREFLNDFSIYTFPDSKNLQQYLKLGAAIQNLSLQNSSGRFNFYNVFGHAEYRNRSRNQQWIIEANGKLYFVGLNAGDYHAYASLQRFVGKRRGYAQLGFENVNRTPSFVYDARSDFYLHPTSVDFKKENTIHAFASLYQPALKLRLGADYYALTNYTYTKNYYELQQESTLFNVLQLSAQKDLRLGRRWVWHADVYFQQVIGNAEVNIPTIYTRNRIGYEGSLGFKNLDIAFGAELRYHSDYKGDAYSPVLGRFFYQDNVTIKDVRPEIAGYLNFRIKSFKLFLRAENLNSANFSGANGFGWTRSNIEVPTYPYPGFVLRLAIFWSFVN